MAEQLSKRSDIGIQRSDELLVSIQKIAVDSNEIKDITVGTNRTKDNSERCLEQIQFAMNDFTEIASSAAQLDEKSQKVTEIF